VARGERVVCNNNMYKEHGFYMCRTRTWEKKAPSPPRSFSLLINRTTALRANTRRAHGAELLESCSHNPKSFSTIKRITFEQSIPWWCIANLFRTILLKTYIAIQIASLIWQMCIFIQNIVY